MLAELETELSRLGWKFTWPSLRIRPIDEGKVVVSTSYLRILCDQQALVEILSALPDDLAFQKELCGLSPSHVFWHAVETAADTAKPTPRGPLHSCLTTH